MAQARVVRAALQPHVTAPAPAEAAARRPGGRARAAPRAPWAWDVLVLGDMNSAETDAAAAPLRDAPLAARFADAVPSAQRTFIVQTLRCVDVRTPGYTLDNVHGDGAPTWRRGRASSQLDHILHRLAAPPPRGDGARADAPAAAAATREIVWLPPGVTDHALLIADFALGRDYASDGAAEVPARAENSWASVVAR